MGDAALLRMLNKKGFMDWWMQLAPSGLSVARSVRLLGLIPSSQFRLSDALAWAAASVGTLGPEDWIAGYGLEMESELPLERGSRIALPDRPSTAHESFTIQRLWPSISFAAPIFPSLLAEHCTAWRVLGLSSVKAAPPLEHLLLEEPDFVTWLGSQGNRCDPVLNALARLFVDPGQQRWSEKAWLRLLDNPNLMLVAAEQPGRRLKNYATALPHCFRYVPPTRKRCACRFYWQPAWVSAGR